MPKERLSNNDVAPDGWVLRNSNEDPLVDIVLIRRGLQYVPVKPAPRTWTGTIGNMRYEAVENDPSLWGDDVVVTVTEVLPSAPPPSTAQEDHA